MPILGYEVRVEDSGPQLVPVGEDKLHILTWNCPCRPELDGWVCDRGCLHTQLLHRTLVT